ncbi:unnamed protein product [Jaminaea pallidilutea]
MSAQGRCNCGRFAFTVPASQGVAACFCKCCVRAGGSLCSLNAVIPVDSIQFTKGSKQELNVFEDNETASGKPMNRYFCGSCGSHIQSIPADSEVAYFKLSTLEDPEAYTNKKAPNMVIFTSRAPSWSRPEGDSGEMKPLAWPSADDTSYSG